MFAYTVRSVSGFVDTFLLKEILIGEQLGEYFGASLASGDINGDGMDDLVIGAPQYTNDVPGYTSQNEGRVFVYFGSNSVVTIFSNTNLKHKL